MNKKLLCAILSVLMLFTAVTSLVACADKDNPNTDKGNQSAEQGNQSAEEVTYRIDFVSNGGGAVEAIVKKAGEEITEPAAPVKNGFVFDGWYESVDNGSTFADKPFVFAYMPARNCTLYAKWSEQIVRYTITFESNGGSSVNAIEAKAGEKIEEPAIPTKDGYIFDGWYESSDNGATLAEKPFVFGYMPSQSIKLYAKWALKTVAGKAYKQSDTRFNWKNDEEKALYLEHSPSTEAQWIAYFGSMKVGITFADEEKVTVSFYNTKKEQLTSNLLYAISDDNVIKFYENEEAKAADRKYKGVGLFLHTFKIADDHSNVTIIVEMTAYDTNGDPLVTVELDMICTVGGN